MTDGNSYVYSVNIKIYQVPNKVNHILLSILILFFH
jgi:hypothetical protein